MNEIKMADKGQTKIQEMGFPTMSDKPFCRKVGLSEGVVCDRFSPFMVCLVSDKASNNVFFVLCPENPSRQGNRQGIPTSSRQPLDTDKPACYQQVVCHK